MKRRAPDVAPCSPMLPRRPHRPLMTTGRRAFFLLRRHTNRRTGRSRRLSHQLCPLDRRVCPISTTITSDLQYTSLFVHYDHPVAVVDSSRAASGKPSTVSFLPATMFRRSPTSTMSSAHDIVFCFSRAARFLSCKMADGAHRLQIQGSARTRHMRPRRRLRFRSPYEVHPVPPIPCDGSLVYWTQEASRSILPFKVEPGRPYRVFSGERSTARDHVIWTPARRPPSSTF